MGNCYLRICTSCWYLERCSSSLLGVRINCSGFADFELCIATFFKELKEYHSYAYYSQCVIIMSTAFLGLALFMTCCQTFYDSGKRVDISKNLKMLVAMAVTLSVLIVNTMYVSHMYRNIRRNKQQIDIREKMKQL